MPSRMLVSGDTAMMKTAITLACAIGLGGSIQAAKLANEIGARIVIPCHFDMFEFNTASPDEFIRTCKQIGQSYRVLRGGERWSTSEFGRS